MIVGVKLVESEVKDIRFGIEIVLTVGEWQRISEILDSGPYYDPLNNIRLAIVQAVQDLHDKVMIPVAQKEGAK